MNKKIIIILIFVFSLFTNTCFADVLHLKNGSNMEGKILEETNSDVIFEIFGGKITISKLEISRIKYEEFKEAVTDDVTVNINPMIELDFKTKSEIYDIRKQYVSRHPGLISVDYKPSDAVFGQIEDGKAWWGILGLSYYGTGEKSIAGPSEESRFLINPFLLVGLDEGCGHIVTSKKLSPKAIYPKPIKLSWKTDRSQAQCRYNVRNFWAQQVKYLYLNAKDHTFELIAYNARDFGFDYLYLVPEKSKKVTSVSNNKEPVLIKQYIHCGGSSGYAGGSNNMSPKQPDLKIKVNGLPGSAYIKLWRKKPKNVNQTADMVFIIEMI